MSDLHPYLWKRTFLLLLLALFGSAASLPVRAQANDSGVRYNTKTMIVDTVKALPQCLQYCLLGFEIRVRYTGVSYEVYLVPRVAHNMAALHVMTSDRFPKEAYIEWAATVGQLQKRLLDEMARVVPPLFGGVSLVESDGGRTRYGEYGHHQSTNFKEVEFMGHPVAILPSLVDKNGNISGGSGAGSSSSSGGSGDAGSGLTANTAWTSGVFSFFNQWTIWSRGCFGDPNACATAPLAPSSWIKGLFDMAKITSMIAQAVKVSGVNFARISKTIENIGTKLADQVGAGGGLKMDRLLCRNNVDYFYPYYLSGVDALFWRSGWPITDRKYTLTMFNPLSSDRIGAGAIWSHVYPRHGFINNDHPGHTAPVAAYRGADLVADSGEGIRPKRTTSYARGSWQNLSPEPTKYCEANIASLPTPIDGGGGYAHNIWPRFTCPLSEIGIYVGFIPYNYCF